MIKRASDGYALLALVADKTGVRATTPGHSSGNIRLIPALQMARELIQRTQVRSRSRRDGLYLFQFDDFALQRLRSVAFGRTRGDAALVRLIMDPYFYYSHGFQEIRTLATNGALPDWTERDDVLFWRGRGTHNGRSATGEPITGLSDVPRTRLALHLRTNPHADVGLIGPWIQAESDEEAINFFMKESIYRAPIRMVEHARYKFQLDIDGVANAWSTLERFLAGSCVLKIGTPFEMWFYHHIHPWVHFVPVRADGADIDEQLQWCLDNPEQAHAIARAGQAFALSLTWEKAVQEATESFAACRILL